MAVLKHREVTEKVIRAFFDVYNDLGPGYLESVYRESMIIALHQAGLDARREIPVPVYFRGHPVGNFKADILVNGVVLLELKTARAIDDSHQAQLMHYLRATDVEVGLLLNFGPRAEFKRMVFENARKNPRKSAKSAVGAA
jgi:GxxExxY protein